MARTFSLVAAPAALLLATLSGANAHALISDIRVPGPAHLATCGKSSFDEVTKDPTGHIEDQEPVNPGCELQLCRGLLFKDQAATAGSIVTAAPGGNITFNVECTIPHGGPANVSLIDTTTGGTGTVIGNFLKEFEDFCPTDGVTPPDQSTLQVTLPGAATIAGRCTKPGDCVTQLFWATPDLTQNYYYCKDTVISGGDTIESPFSSHAEVPNEASFDLGATETEVPTGVVGPGQEVATPEETSVEDPAIVGQPPDIQDTDPAMEIGVVDTEAPTGTDATVGVGVEDTTIVDQPTGIEGIDIVVETGVEDTATSTGAADAQAPTDRAHPAPGKGKSKDKTSLPESVNFFTELISKGFPQATAAVGQSRTAKRWAKEHY